MPSFGNWNIRSLFYKNSLPPNSFKNPNFKLFSGELESFSFSVFDDEELLFAIRV
jgi:hypothetical protein